VGSSYRKGGHEADHAEAAIPAPLVSVFVTTAVWTGAGPGHRRVSPGEAAALVSSRRAVYGDQPPHGYAGMELEEVWTSGPTEEQE
jgi:hypothetical protein